MGAVHQDTTLAPRLALLVCSVAVCCVDSNTKVPSSSTPIDSGEGEGEGEGEGAVDSADSGVEIDGHTVPAELEQGGPVACADPSLRETEGPFEHLDHALDAAGAPEAPDEPIQAGITAADFNADGHLDLLLAQHDGMDLFVGDGTGGLTHAPDALPEPRPGWSNHAATVAADFDVDGDIDVVLVNRAAPDELWWNDGSAGFTRDDTAPFASETRASVGASLDDVDGDGDLDLFIAGHYAGTPRGPADDSALYLWTGSAFQLAADVLPEDTHAGYTFNGTWVDTDLDGDRDLYMVNDHGNVAIPNRLLVNDSAEGGVGLQSDAEPGLDATMLGMGVAVADLNDDARPDFLVTNFGQLRLFESLDDGSWFESSLSRGLIQDFSTQVVGWSTIVEDFDHDADLDVWVTFGSLPSTSPEFANPFAQPDGLWVQEDGRFTQDAAAWGLDDDSIGRGGIAIDLNEDGWLDIVTAPLITLPRVHLSRCGEGAWLMVELVQPGENPAAIGAQVEVQAEGRSHRRWVVAGGTQIFGSPPPVAHVGLAEATEVTAITVTWPDGLTSTVGPLAPNQLVRVVRQTVEE